jgi:hypothetical protein
VVRCLVRSKAREQAPVKKSDSLKKFVFRRRAPDLPREMHTEFDPVALFASDDISIADRAIEGARIETRGSATLRIEASVLQRVSLADSRCASIVLKDVRLIGCDLANLETRALTLVRVEFISCRMTGFRAGEADCQDVLISEDSAPLSSMPATLKKRISRVRSSPAPSSENAICGMRR